MDQEIINSYSKLSGLNVSRETFSDFESYISMILEKNEKINLISDKFSNEIDLIIDAGKMPHSKGSSVYKLVDSKLKLIR